MKPFIYNFLELPPSDYSEALDSIEYSTELNLSIVKGTNQPAITLHTLSTQTFKKGKNEGEDVDRDNCISVSGINSLGTQTFTRADREMSDNDHNRSINAVKTMTETSTFTLTGREPSDSDNQKLFMMLSTRTMTESKEATDSDY